VSPARLGFFKHASGICVGEALVILGLSGRGSAEMVGFMAVVRGQVTVGVTINAVPPVGAAMACIDVYVGNKTRLAATVDAV
jgi:hypothetical protein